MKLRYALPIFLLCSSYELVTDYSFVDKHHPFHLDGEYRKVGAADFRTPSVKHSHVHYADAHAFAYFSHFLTPDNSLSWKVGYSFLDFDWDKNPRFKTDDYHFANASLGWVSTSVQDWRWILSAGASVDATTFNFGQSGVYYGLMWGRYQLSPTVGMHIGWAGYIGFRNLGYLLPILGVDWRPSEHWRVNGIFPINVSVEYVFDEFWSAALQWATFGRPYRFPMRIHGGHGRFENGIFEVYSKGLELDVKFHTGNVVAASVGAGWNFGGWVLVKNSHFHHGKYYQFNGAPYVQGRLGLTF